MIKRETLKFLKELAKNNNREWFQENKKLYEAAQSNLIDLTAYLAGEVAKFDEQISVIDPKSNVFRIYRDIRFSKDKSPYKTNLGLSLSPGGRKSSIPGYYFHVQPGRSFIAGGKYMPDASEVLKIRNSIAGQTDAFFKIINKKSFREAFGDIRGEKLKTTPKGFPVDHKAIEYLKLKSFISYREDLEDKFLTSDGFPAHLVASIKEMYPFVAFLRKALENRA